MKIPRALSTTDRRASIELMIQLYRRARQRRLVRLAMKTWRQAATERQFAKLEERPERIH